MSEMSSNSVDKLLSPCQKAGASCSDDLLVFVYVCCMKRVLMAAGA